MITVYSLDGQKDQYRRSRKTTLNFTNIEEQVPRGKNGLIEEKYWISTS